LKRFPSLFRGVLSRRDRVYLLGLLAPLVTYSLALKASNIASRPGGRGLVRDLRLMRSDAFFNLGYTLLWFGLFAAARKGPLRRAVIFLFHITSILAAIFRTGAYQYYRETGTTLDYDIIALWIPRFGEVKPMIQLPRSAWSLLASALLYAVLGPSLLARAFSRRRGAEGAPAGEPGGSPLVSLGLCLSALGFGSLSLPVGPGSAVASRSFARDALANLAWTGIMRAVDRDEAVSGRAVEHPAARAVLAETPRTERRNVVLIHLESTRARSVTPYNRELKTTPFLNELAKESLLVERAYTTVPHTAKAVASVNCGIEPGPRPNSEVEPGGIPAPGLASLLKGQGYSTAFFQSSIENFDDLGDLAKNLGYEEYYPLESMDTEGFERSNYFGYEDDIMLGPSEEWLKKHKDEPFMVKYLTGTGHHEYLPPTRYGLEDFSEDDRLNRYLNCLRYQDFFVKNLIEQYKNLGLYEGTIFVLYGDHGEAFGEHGRYAHDDVPYEESLKVPLIIHDPRRSGDGKRIEGLSNLTDILPTVLELLGYEVENGEYPGYSLLHPLPEDRALTFSCFNKNKCLASIKGSEKYIHHYGNQPDELFDLSIDAFEQQNLASERDKGETNERREELLAWRSEISARYAGRAARPRRALKKVRGLLSRHPS
jgi:phosphoglycerol transferase MdoB-like AlkP superfamily enzyme